MSCESVPTHGDGVCVGRPWGHHDCAAYRWRGDAGTWAEDETPASLTACSPERNKLRHI